jgi:hypothetical protein
MGKMTHRAVSAILARLSAEPCFRVWGKARWERDWSEIAVYATERRNLDSKLPLWRGCCITWTAYAIAVGWDFAADLVREQAAEPASPEHPVEVQGGRLRDLERRTAVGAPPWPTAGEIMAHECGHTGQARRLGLVYWPLGAALTPWREGPRWYNAFERQASEVGQFGGFVNGSVCDRLRRLLAPPSLR